MAVLDKSFGGYRIFVGDLGRTVSKHSLRRVYEYYGPLLDIWLARNPPGFAFLVYKHRDDAEKAVDRTHGRSVCGRIVRVEHARPFEPKGKSHVFSNSIRSRSRSRSRDRTKTKSRSKKRTRSRSRSRSHSKSRSKRKRSKERSKEKSNDKLKDSTENPSNEGPQEEQKKSSNGTEKPSEDTEDTPKTELVEEKSNPEEQAAKNGEDNPAKNGEVKLEEVSVKPADRESSKFNRESKKGEDSDESSEES